MSEKGPKNTARSAAIFPIAERREGDRVEGMIGVAGTDEGAIEEAVQAFEEDTGHTTVRLTPDQARISSNRFAFSSSTWNAPWEPIGPKPPGVSRDNLEN